MKLRTLVSALLVCAVTPFARGATANSPTPANYSIVPTHTPTLKEFLAKKSKASEYYPTGMFFKYTTTGTDARIVLGNDYKTNGIVRLSWKGTTGESTVIIKRLSDGNERTLTTTGTSVDFDAPDIGRNYKWTVKNGSNTAGPWYFYTEDEAPRIIPQRLAVVGNCRDMGGWKTADGQYRVRQGLGYRNDHNADFAKYEQLKPFWTDIAKVRTDMDLRDTLGSSRWYCNYELDENDMHYGRSPYGANWWSVTYWNIVRENDYGGYMLAYKPLVDKRTGMAKYSASTWKLFSSVKNLPIVVHCSQGRDRTGTVAFVLLGALGVPLNDLYADWALTDYAAPKDFPTGGTAGEREIIALYNAINSVYTNAKGYTNLQAKCEKLLSDLGVDASQITALKSLLLEPVEAPITSAADLDGRTKVDVPKLNATSFKQDGKEHKPTVTVDTTKADVDFGKGNYKDYGHYRVKVTLKDPNTTKWSDGTIGQKDFDVFVYHSGNVFSANVQSFIKGDTSKRIRIARPRYMAQVTCNYTEEQLNNLAPGTYTASFTAKTCPLATSNTSKSKFTVYPATEKPAYIYTSATLDQAFCKTDYVPALKTDKVVMRIEDLADGLGGGYFQSGNYPAVMCMFKLSAGAYRFHQGTQNTGFSNFTWAQNKLYELTIQGKTGSLKEINKTTGATVTTKSATVTLDSVTATPGSAFIGTSLSASVDSGVEGTPEYHAKHRFYSLKVYANGTKLTHEFVPCETASGKAMIYDKVTEKLYPFSNVSGGSEGKVTLEGEKTKIGGDDPVVDPTEPDPTEYGAADTAASTYTWKGGNGPWEYTTNWTASTGAKYGIPSHATYATADFPATVTKATECTLTSDRSVSVVKFDSPNLALTLNNAKLTVAGWIDDDRIGAFNFGDTASGNSTLTLSGSKAALVATRGSVRANFGSQKSGTTGSCTVKFVVPATGWESTAPIRETGSDAKVCFWYNVRFDIDARALGVPADGVVKRVLLASSTVGISFYGDDKATTFAHSTILCADGAKGELAVDGNALVLKVTGDSTPQVEPAPTPSSLFDAAHTIVCYGDSLTWGESSAEITMDSRANYHDGRLAGVAKTPQSYPYWLSGLIPASYNVINQSRSGSQTCNITSWSGEQAVMVEQSFTLPAVGSVSISKNLSFKNPKGWGKWGGWVDIEGYDQSVVDRWSGFVPPIYPLMEKYDANRTRYSVTGTLAGRRVRLQGMHPTNITVTVFGEGSAQTVEAGSEFVPDSELVSPYKDAIRIICTGANDANDDYIGQRYATHIKPLLQAFANRGGKYLIVSPSVNMGGTGATATTIEKQMASDFGNHYLNLRMAMETNGLATATALGVPFTGKWTATDGTGLKGKGDTVHFNEKGYKVMAEFIRQKLVALGYIENEEPTPPPAELTDYYASKSQTISTYQSTALWFKNAACTTKWSAYPNAYDAAVHFAPNSGVNQILVLDDNLNAKAGEVVFEGNASLRYGTQTFQNNTTTPKAIWSVRSGEAGAVCQGLVLTGTGTGYVDICGNASAAFTTATLSDNLSIRFNPSDCANAKVRFDSTDGNGLTTFAALKGGATAATQGLTVENAFAKATSTTVASGVAGKLEITVKLGDKNTATTDAPLTFAGTFNVNAGSTLTVDAGGKSAGTYPLIAAGTLTDNANLANSATVSGVASGFKASVAKSGNKINLVIEKIDEPTPPPPGPVDPEAVSTNAMATASWGYEIHGLGTASNEVALVFTNCDASAGMSWKVPDGVTSFEFLVVGGGGGGASSYKAQRAGGGGGAGGVVYGTATALTAGAQLSIDVGAGGKGGVYTNKYPQCSAGDGGNSSIVCQDTTWVTAFGGGHGAHVNYSGAAGGSGGGAGCNSGTSCAGGAATAGSVAQLAFLQAQTFGNRGGANWTSTAVAVAGGGGGAGAQGADATSSTSGAGGDGKAFDITGESVWYAGGGGAGVSSSKASDARSGGNGGGGHGGAHTGSASGVAAENGTNGLGGGGGGAGYYQSGKAGGSGVVIIRYAVTGGEEPPQPVVDPTKYGEADKSAATYTWKGPSGMWNYTTSWTPSTASATYGIPNNKANATAEFPATLTSAFTCTVTNNMTVDFAKFDSPNMTLVLDNASLTCNDRLDMENWGSYYFGNGPTGDTTIEFKGANAALVSTKESIRAQFGCLGGEATGVCTLRFVVPASGWTKTTAPVRTGGDSKVFLNANVRLDIDATALGVPTAGQTTTAILVASTDGIIVRPADLGAVSTIDCAQGAHGELVLEDSTGSHFKTLKLVVSPDSTPLSLALTAPAANATDVAVIRPAQAAFFALDRDARWAQVDDQTARDAMVDASSFPQDVEFAWQGGTAPYAFTLTRNRDGKAVKTVADLAEATVSVGNLETGRAYTWTVTDAAGKSASRSFTTAYADQRFLRVPAANAYNAVKGFASTKSADVHNGYLPNFRDLGGMFTADGSKRVKQGVAYRSFGFDSASTPSLGVDTAVVVGELGVKTDLDLRGGDELVNIKDGKSPLGADVTWVNCPTKPYGIDKLGEADAAALRVFKDPAKLPVVFHCSAGQDRTGTLAMMLGAILDLDEEDIEKGWSASCFFQNGMDQDDGQGHVDTGFQTHRVKTFFGDYAKYGQPGDTFAACVRAALKAKLGMTEDDFAAIRANLLEEDTEVTRPVKATVEVPDPNAIAREYDGTVQTTYLRTNPRYTVAMAADAVDPGDYPVTLKLVDPGVCAWADGSADDKTVIFTITGEKPTEDDGPVPSFNASTGELTFSNGVQYVYLADKTYTPSKAIFEPGASILANGADVSIDKVYLQGAGNAFTAEGVGSKITLTPYQKSTVAANTPVSFAADGGIISVGKTASGDEWTFDKSGMTLSVSALNNAYIGLSGVSFTGKVLMDATDSTVKFNDFTVAAAGSEIGLTNSTLKTNWNVTMGETAAATVTLAGVAPLMQAANGPLTLGKNLTVKLVPELDWPEDQGRFHSIGSGTYATVTLASGVKFDVDVSKFAGLTTNVTFCLLSAPNTQTPSIALPTAANVKVSGEGAENCTVAFTKSGDGRRVYVTVTAAGKLYPDWIGAGDEANKAKFDAWVEKFGVSDRPGANETAYLLNCAATDEAIETAIAAFKIPSIAVTDGVVEVARPVHPEAPGADFNGEVVIRGSATVTGDYELSEDSEDARFYKAFLGYAE